MAEETKIGIKLEEEAKPIKKMCEKLMDAINYELDKGIENIETKELGEAVDMVKDLYEAKKAMYEACYFKGVLEAMEEHDFENEEEIMNEGRRGYRGQPRDSRGRYMSRGRGGRRGYEPDMMMYDEDWEEMERMRDLDRDRGRMGYGNSGSSGGSSSGGMSGGNSGGSSGGSSSGGGSRGYSEGNGGQMSSRMQRDSESRYDKARRGYEETKSMGANTPESKQSKMKELENYMKTMAEDLTEAIEGASPEERSLAKQKLSMLVQKM